MCMDVLTLKDEELEGLGITREEFNEILKTIKENTSKYGELLRVYAIEIEAPDRVHDGKTEIKLKITDDLKGYNTFKLIYLDDENGFVVKEVVDLKIDGEYLDGILPHLSAYALVADNVEETSNPKTGDSGITLWVSLMLISTLGIIVTRNISKK